MPGLRNSSPGIYFFPDEKSLPKSVQLLPLLPCRVKGGITMQSHSLKPYTLDTELTGYLPVPREMLDLGLPSTAVLIYGALLDRGTLSRKNAYADESGWVYVIYPVDRLAETFHISDTAE